MAMRYRLIAGGRTLSSEASTEFGHRASATNRASVLASTDEPRDIDRNAILADSVLMRAVAEGEGDAFARLIRAESPRLTRFVAGMLTSLPEAEEIVQEALLRLWKQAAAWDAQARIGTYLHHVAYRLAVDRLRRRRPHVDIDGLDDVIEDTGPTPESGLVRADDVRLVREALDQLPERQRAAILLAHFQELGQAEAASIMGVGEHAYESLLARARRRLRVLLTGQGEDDREEGTGS